MLDIEDFYEENPPRPGQTRSKFQSLVASLAFDLKSASIAQDELDQWNFPAVGLFFQLPYCLNMQDDWFLVESTREGIHAKVRVSQRRLQIDDLGNASSTDEINESPAKGVTFSQVTALIPLWGGRETFYQYYLAADQMSPRIIVPASKSWDKTHMAMTASDYEHNLCRRYFLEAINIQRKVIPTYRLLSMHDVSMSDRIYGYCVLPRPFRITSHHVPDPILRGVTESRQTNPHRWVKIEDFKANYKPRSDFSPIFEKSIFKSQRLISDGEYDLGIVSLHSAVEGFLKSRLPKRIDRIKMMGLLEHPFYAFLNPELKAILDEMRNARNSIVHADKSSKVTSSFLERNSILSRREAEKFLEISFSLYREVNLHTT